MSFNLYKRLRNLFPGDPLLVGTVSEVQTGRVIVTLPDGSTTPARGEATIGQHVYVKGGAIEGLAPSLSVIEIEI